MALEIKGKIVKILELQTGTSANGNWSKRDFVIETVEEQYPKKVCFTVWSEKADSLDKLYGEGSLVNVSFALESREYMGKWYTTARAWKIDTLAGLSAGGTMPTASAPPIAPPPSSPPLPTDAPENPFLAESDDNLPF
ncbi:MAG: DUF3127 domain-containing protein [Bacteroidales bacterium]|jgi:bacillopeptidase F (M6 metalloprotease family)|nr:DUF3127 domain-containing protein [Bacteroidales bacterium]